ncbi:LysR substrate-binding domain-containing protein [Streptomyces sp. NPDC018321]|uniref:LysR substrate-binding domain-containing protein n=1 Tax=unclassified Streptomyces TaxID=2593676 RepID=UPI0037891ACD
MSKTVIATSGRAAVFRECRLPGEETHTVQTAIARAIAAGTGTTGELHLGYMSAAIARHVLPLGDAFHAGTPGCRVTIRETALDNLYGPLRRAEVDRSCRCPSVAEPDLTVGPVLLSEAALLAVPADHHLAPGCPVSKRCWPTSPLATAWPSSAPRPNSSTRAPA